MTFGYQSKIDTKKWKDTKVKFSNDCINIFFSQIFKEKHNWELRY